MISWSLYSSWIIRYSINIFLHSVLWQQNWCILCGCEPVSFMADCGLCGNCPICVRFELFLVRMYKVTTAGHQYDSDFLTSSRYSVWLQNVTNCCLLQFCISQRLPIILSIPGDAWVFFQIANIMNWVCALLQKCNSNWGHRFCIMVCLNFGQISIYRSWWSQWESWQPISAILMQVMTPTVMLFQSVLIWRFLCNLMGICCYFFSFLSLNMPEALYKGCLWDHLRTKLVPKTVGRMPT